MTTGPKSAHALAGVVNRLAGEWGRSGRRRVAGRIAASGGTPMIARRRLLETTLFGGLLGGATVPGPESEDSQSSEPRVQEIIDGLKDIRKAIDGQQNNAEIVGLRQRQMDFLRASG